MASNNPNDEKFMVKLNPKCKVGDFAREVVAAVLIPDDDGFISTATDKSIRVYLKRESGRYWPSICRYLPACPTDIVYEQSGRHAFVSMDDGNLVGFVLSDDLNSLTETFKFGGHVSSVTSLIYSQPRHIILSTGEDKRLSWNNTENGHLIGSVVLKSVTTCVCIDSLTGCTFVGEDSGKIQFLNIDAYKISEPLKSTELCKHDASVNRLLWDESKKRLFSCGADKLVIVWEIGGQKGECLEFYGQDENPCGLGIDIGASRLITCYSNGVVMFWDLDAHREPPAVWEASDKCQRCNAPFFWDVKEMWSKKKLGLRQHHCRRCGRAICNNCSRYSSVLPVHGFEIPVRICSDCHSAIDITDKRTLACYSDVNHPVTAMDYDPVTRRLLTVGRDRTIKVWEVQFLKKDSE